jgi:hypothetical protein
MVNKDLKNQLELFERRLEDSIKKRSRSENKSRVTTELEESSELRSVYRQCDIYRRQIAELKRRESLFDDSEIN